MIEAQQNLGLHLGQFQALMRAPLRAMNMASQMRELKEVARRGAHAGAGICCLFSGGGALAAGGQIIVPLGVLAAGGFVFYQAFQPSKNGDIQHVLNNMVEAVQNLHELHAQQNRAVHHIQAEADRALNHNQEMNLHLNQMRIGLEGHELLRANFLQRFQNITARIQEIFQNSQNANAEALDEFRNTGEHLNVLRRALELMQERVAHARDHNGQFSLTPNQARFIRQINREELNQHWVAMGTKIRKMIHVYNQLQIATNELFSLQEEVLNQQNLLIQELNQNLAQIQQVRIQQEEPLQRIAAHVELHQKLSKRLLKNLQKLLKCFNKFSSKLSRTYFPILLIGAICCLISLLRRTSAPLIAVPIFIVVYKIAQVSKRILLPRNA